MAGIFHQSNARYATVGIRRHKHYYKPFWCFVRLDIVPFFSPQCNLTQPVKPAPNITCLYDKFQSYDWYFFFLRKQFKIEEKVWFCQCLSQRKQQVLYDLLQLCVLHHITEQYLYLWAVGYFKGLAAKICEHTHQGITCSRNAGCLANFTKWMGN